VRAQGGGRRRCEDRAVLAAIIFVAASGCTWRQAPPVFGASWRTVHRRFTDWSTARVWAPAAAPGQAARGQGLRLRPSAPLAAATADRASHCPPRYRAFRASGPIPLGGGAHDVLAERLPSTAPPIRAQGRTLPRLHRHRQQSHLLPQEFAPARVVDVRCWLSRSAELRHAAAGIPCLVPWATRPPALRRRRVRRPSSRRHPS
jgi:transposase